MCIGRFAAAEDGAGADAGRIGDSTQKTCAISGNGYGGIARRGFGVERKGADGGRKRKNAGEKRLVREQADKLYQENGARSGHVIDALVDWEQVKVKEGRVEGLDGQIAEIKRRYAYLFEPDVPPPQFSVGMGDAPAADESRAVREAMGL